MILPEDFRYSRNPEELLREVDAAIKVKDIEAIQRHRERVELKWWESAIVVMLFISGLGFIITIFKLLPQTNKPLFWFVFFWFAIFTLTLVATIEFLLAKINALRHLYEVNSKLVERLEKHLPPEVHPSDKKEPHP